MSLFSIIYLIGLGLGSAIRVIYGRKYKHEPNKSLQTDPLDRTLLGLVSLGFLIPLFYIFTDWFAFANYSRPDWIGWLGTAIYLFGVFLLWRSHVDLGRNWSPELAVRESQELIQDGVYRYIRHPMYAAHLYWGIGQVGLLDNWLAGPSLLVFALLLFGFRIPREERMLEEEFGEAYYRYKKIAGRFFPVLFSKS